MVLVRESEILLIWEWVYSPTANNKRILELGIYMFKHRNTGEKTQKYNTMKESEICGTFLKVTYTSSFSYDGYEFYVRLITLKIAKTDGKNKML